MRVPSVAPQAQLPKIDDVFIAMAVAEMAKQKPKGK
jgi:hypothetical protein